MTGQGMEPDSRPSSGWGFPMRMGLLQEAGRDSCEQNGKGFSVKTQVPEGWCDPGEFPQKKESVVAQLFPIFCDPINCSLPGSSGCGNSQAGVLGWIAIPISRGSSQLGE